MAANPAKGGRRVTTNQYIGSSSDARRLGAIEAQQPRTRLDLVLHELIDTARNGNPHEVQNVKDLVITPALRIARYATTAIIGVAAIAVTWPDDGLFKLDPIAGQINAWLALLLGSVASIAIARVKRWVTQRRRTRHNGINKDRRNRPPTQKGRRPPQSLPTKKANQRPVKPDNDPISVVAGESDNRNAHTDL